MFGRNLQQWQFFLFPATLSYTFHFAETPRFQWLFKTFGVPEVCQDYANVMANTVVYARCFVQEINKNTNLSKEAARPGETCGSRDLQGLEIWWPPRSPTCHWRLWVTPNHWIPAWAAEECTRPRNDGSEVCCVERWIPSHFGKCSNY